jgi:hypothetical protein
MTNLISRGVDDRLSAQSGLFGRLRLVGSGIESDDKMSDDCGIFNERKSSQYV